MWLDEKGDARSVERGDDVVVQQLGDRFDVVRVRRGGEQLLIRSFDTEDGARRFLNEVALKVNGR